MAGAALAFACFGTPASAVKMETKTVEGFKADVFTWKDSGGRERSVALKKEGSGNAGHGGYAIRMTYQYDDATGAKRKLVADAEKGDGFGYFVSHERFRKFADGSSDTIAKKIFGKDDSPLGRQFKVETKLIDTGKNLKSIRYSLVYPRYGTIAPGGINSNTGEDQPPLGTTKNLFKLYDLPVSITWFFEDGTDYPRIRTTVGLGKLPGPDRASFDLRGPYGKIDFDGGVYPIKQVVWGDRFHFQTNSAVLTRNSPWTWNAANGGARYTALIGGGEKEIGLFEPQFYRYSVIKDGFAFGRGKTSVTHDTAGAGCGGQELPCDYEWPYQSSQYELPYGDPNAATTSEKLAWGSSPFYGMSIPAVYDGTASTSFDGFPKSKKISYDICLVMGQTVGGSLTLFTSDRGELNEYCASPF